jgi:hypothetical protein
MAFPSNILSLADAIGSQFLSVFFGGSVSHATGINQMKTDLVAVETKVGTGASTATANTVLRGTGTGTTAFGAVVNADVSSSAAIAVSKLAAGSANSVLTSNGTTDAFSATPTVTSLTATGSVTGTTDVRSGGKFFAGGQALLGLSVPVQATVTSGNSALIASAVSQGFVFVTDLSNGRNAIFEIQSALNTVALSVGDTSLFSIAAPAADNKIHGIYSAGNYYLYNGYGVSHSLYAALLAS